MSVVEPKINILLKIMKWSIVIIHYMYSKNIQFPVQYQEFIELPTPAK